MLLQSFQLDFVPLNKFQGRRGWSNGPLTTAAVAPSMATVSCPSPCEETRIRNRSMTMKGREKKLEDNSQSANMGIPVQMGPHSPNI